jgi:hypothetical protein
MSVDVSQDDKDEPPRWRYEQPAGMPLWLRVVAITAVIAVLVLFVVLHLTGVLGGGTHQ